MNIFRILFLSSLLLFTFLIKSFAQENVYQPDSIISYSLLTLDTFAKTPTSKEVNKYTTDFKLGEKQLFSWNRETKQWVLDKKFEIHHYPTEILVEVYSNEKAPSLTHKGRILLKVDPSNHLITQVTALTKEKNLEKYSVWKQIDYTYRKDTCISSKVQQKGSTLFLAKETKLEKTKVGYQLKEQFYRETGKKDAGQAIYDYLFSNKLLRTISCKSNVNEMLLFKDSLIYEKGKLKSIRHTNSTTSNKPILLNQNYQTEMSYNEMGNLILKIRYIENKSFQRVQNQLNNFEKVYCNPKSQIVKRNYFAPSLEESLMLLNETN